MRKAFTLIELLAVIGIVGMLGKLLHEHYIVLGGYPRSLLTAKAERWKHVYLIDRLVGRSCCIESLNEIHAHLDNCCQFFLGLNAFCQCFQLILMAELDNRSYKLLLFQIVMDIADE